MPSAAVRDEGALQMRPAPCGYSSARLHDLKFTFTPAGTDDSVHSKAPLPRGGCLRSAQTGRVFETHSFLSLPERKERFQSSKKRKSAVQNRKCKPYRHRVRRSQLHSVSAGAAKTPYPQPSSSFPNCDRFTGSQFGSRKFYNAARDLDDGGKAVTFGCGKN